MICVTLAFACLALLLSDGVLGGSNNPNRRTVEKTIDDIAEKILDVEVNIDDLPKATRLDELRRLRQDHKNKTREFHKWKLHQKQSDTKLIMQSLSKPSGNVEEVNKFLLESKEMFERNLKKPMPTVSYRDFTSWKPLGDTSGTTTAVYTVVHKPTGKMYVVKTEDDPEPGDKLALEREMKYMTAIEFPFVLKGRWTFVKGNNAYLVMDKCKWDLRAELDKSGSPFSERRLKIYAAQIILGVQFLHSINITHRDLKLTNVFVDSDGYLKVADFDAARMKAGKRYKAKTMVGTYEFAAPEFMKSKLVTKAADWWSVGLMIYELVTKHIPFEENPHFKTKNCDGGYISSLIGSRPFSNELKSLLSILMHCNYKKRYGYGNSVNEDIKNHPWFNDINWLQVYHKEIEMPWQLN